MFEEVDVLLYHRRRRAVCLFDVVADERLFVPVGVPHQLRVEPVVERGHVAVDAELRLCARARDADGLVVAGRVAEGVEVRERYQVAGEVAVVVPDVWPRAGVGHPGDALEGEGGALVVVRGESVVAPEFRGGPAHVWLQAQIRVVRHSPAVVEEGEDEVRVLLREVACSAVGEFDELDVGRPDAFRIRVLPLQRETFVALAEVWRVRDAKGEFAASGVSRHLLVNLAPELLVHCVA